MEGSHSVPGGSRAKIQGIPRLVCPANPPCGAPGLGASAQTPGRQRSKTNTSLHEKILSRFPFGSVSRSGPVGFYLNVSCNLGLRRLTSVRA